MKKQQNIPTYSVTWLANTYDKNTSKGIIYNYYIPETLDELKSLCKELGPWKVRVVGHTSNIYFLPDTNIKHLISTRLLKGWTIEGDKVVCECGVNVKQLVKAMIEEGAEGFAGMVDLPGTVAAAVYGNAGVGPYLMSKVLVSVEVLGNKGDVKSYSADELKFSERSSAFKRGEVKGTILTCTLKLEYGEKEAIKKEVDYYHEWRVKNQPGPSRNLGTTSLLRNDASTAKGKVVRAISKVVGSCVALITRKDTTQCKTNVTLRLMGMSCLSKYMFGMNRFMWMDADAHKLFSKYVEIINKLYKNPRLEIEIW